MGPSTNNKGGEESADQGKKGGSRQKRLSLSPEMGDQPNLPFHINFVGTNSCHGVEPGDRMGETNAKINQDRGVVVYPFAQFDGCKTVYAFFGVFDGHGHVGDKVSHFVANQIPLMLEDTVRDIECKQKTKNERDAMIETALKKTFESTDENLKKDQSIDAELSGTTAVVCLCRYEKGAANSNKTMTVYVANAGDSRAVLARDCDGRVVSKDLSNDQKPDTKKEFQRIRKAGGYVTPAEEEWGGPARVWLDSSQNLPGLAMARSIGDHLVKHIGVISTPEVLRYEISLTAGSSDKFMILASDGVWEFIDSDQAICIVNENLDNGAQLAVVNLIKEAAARWRQEEGDYRDDITAICIKFDEHLFE